MNLQVCDECPNIKFVNEEHHINSLVTEHRQRYRR